MLHYSFAPRKAGKNMLRKQLVFNRPKSSLKYYFLFHNYLSVLPLQIQQRKMSIFLQVLASSVKASNRAGDLVRDIMKGSDLKIVQKTGEKDLQTLADRSANDCIVGSLKKVFILTVTVSIRIPDYSRDLNTDHLNTRNIWISNFLKFGFTNGLVFKWSVFGFMSYVLDRSFFNTKFSLSSCTSWSPILPKSRIYNVAY